MQIYPIEVLRNLDIKDLHSLKIEVSKKMTELAQYEHKIYRVYREKHKEKFPELYEAVEPSEPVETSEKTADALLDKLKNDPNMREVLKQALKTNQ